MSLETRKGPRFYYLATFHPIFQSVYSLLSKWAFSSLLTYLCNHNPDPVQNCNVNVQNVIDICSKTGKKTTYNSFSPFLQPGIWLQFRQSNSVLFILLILINIFLAVQNFHVKRIIGRYYDVKIWCEIKYLLIVFSYLNI